MMRKRNGSLTVEAAIIFPLVIAVFIIAVNGGISLNQDVRETVAGIEDKEDINTVKMFYRWKVLGELLGDED